MPFPSTLTLVTVSGAFDVPPSGGATGTVDFIADRPLQGSTIVPPFTRQATLASDGTFTIELPATNDPQWTPVSWAYRVVATVAGAVFSGTLQLDYQATAVTLAALFQPSGAAVAGTTYLLLSQRSVAGGVAGLDADGDVIDASGSKITSGGGGGGTPSSTVVSETTYGQSAAAGNATTYARGNHTHGTPPAPAAATITDSTSVGRAVLTAADATAARTAISAASTAHASTHADGGADEISIDGSQVTAGTVPIARLPTGTSGTTVALGNAPAGAIATHEAASDPHPQYAVMNYSTGGGYAAVNSAAIYVGPDDPGAVANGSIWIDTDA